MANGLYQSRQRRRRSAAKSVGALAAGIVALAIAIAGAYGTMVIATSALIP